jgi:hypothetical protein
VSSMLTPDVREIVRPRPRLVRDDFADEPRPPRAEPYRRASQRRLVERSILAELHTDNYPERS